MIIYHVYVFIVLYKVLIIKVVFIVRFIITMEEDYYREHILNIY